MSEQEQETEKSGTGIIGAAAAGAAGGAAALYAPKFGVHSQKAQVIESALNKAPQLAGGTLDAKEAKFVEAVGVAGRKAPAGAEVTFAEKFLGAKRDLAKTGEEALTRDAKKLAKVNYKEGLAGIEAGLKEAKVSTLSVGKYGKAVLVAVPAAIATKVALDMAFGSKHASKVSSDRAAATDQASVRS